MVAKPAISASEQAVFRIGGHFNYESDVVALANGRSVVTWADFSFQGGAYRTQVFAQVIDAAGNQVGGVIPVSVDDKSLSPEITALADGGFVIGYRFAFSSTDIDVLSKRYNANGALVETMDVATSLRNEYLYDILGLTNGGWVATWTEIGTDAQTAGGVYANFYNSTGSLVAGYRVVGFNNQLVQSNAKLAQLNNGNVVIAYTNASSGGDKDVYARVYDQSGNLVIGDFRVSLGISGPVNQFIGSVAALSTGGFAVAYESAYSNSGGLGENDYDVFVDIFTNTGEFVRSVTVSTAFYEQYDPSIVALPDGTFTVSYSDRANDSGNSADIHIISYTNSGMFLGEVNPINATTADSQLFSKSAVLSDGRIITTWTDFGSGDVNYAITDTRTRTRDFNLDGYGDILARGASGEIAVWHMNGTSMIGGGYVTQNGANFNPGNYWSIARTGDFNGDGNSDLLARGNSGEIAVWQIVGRALTSGGYVTQNGANFNPGNYWTVNRTADFNGDGKSDLFGRGASGEMAVWLMDSTALTGGGYVTQNGATFNPSNYWTVAATADFNSDRKADILARGAQGEIAIWTTNGTSLTGGGYVTENGANFNPSNYWSIAGTGDFNNDGRNDILARGSGGEIAIWHMNGTAIQSGGFVTQNGANFNPGNYWSITGAEDVNRDGFSDILARGSNGEIAAWLVNGNALTGGGYVTQNGANFNPTNYWSTVSI